MFLSIKHKSYNRSIIDINTKSILLLISEKSRGCRNNRHTPNIWRDTIDKKSYVFCMNTKQLILQEDTPNIHTLGTIYGSNIHTANKCDVCRTPIKRIPT